MASNIETQGDYHWRNSMRPLKFFGLDARAAASFFVLLLHFRLWTLYLCIVVTGIFSYVERHGYTFPSALRAFRSWIVGDKRPAWMHIRKRPLIDYGE
tara:strand:- start:878 stop:1171 length:294 start_codon:yes stop_codon:yes gene_type:complete